MSTKNPPPKSWAHFTRKEIRQCTIEEIIEHVAQEFCQDNPDHYLHDWIRAAKEERKWILNSCVSRMQDNEETSRKTNAMLYSEYQRRYREKQEVIEELKQLKDCLGITP
jgi:hypothetical protein